MVRIFSRNVSIKTNFCSEFLGVNMTVSPGAGRDHVAMKGPQGFSFFS